MNKVSIISFTENGAKLNLKLIDRLGKDGDEITGYSYDSYQKEGLIGFEKLKNLVEKEFLSQSKILFIGAVAIAVRAIAPFLQGKEKDPAVLVIDEQGNYVISLLSGHIGGGNKWCKEVAAIIGAIPVITTATDLRGAFAVDSFAVENHLRIVVTSQIKEITSRILSGKKVGFYSQFHVEGEIPDGLQTSDLEKLDTGIVISYEEKSNQFPLCCNLVPMDLVIGIGCRKGKTQKDVMKFLLQVLKENHLSKYRIEKICSIDRKAKEEGIQETAKELLVPFVTYTKEQLSKVNGNFSASEFVMEQIGVDNVCERSALLGSNNIWNQNGTLILSKQAQNGITIAIAKREVAICFM